MSMHALRVRMWQPGWLPQLDAGSHLHAHREDASKPRARTAGLRRRSLRMAVSMSTRGADPLGTCGSGRAACTTCCPPPPFHVIPWQGQWLEGPKSSAAGVALSCPALPTHGR